MVLGFFVASYFVSCDSGQVSKVGSHIEGKVSAGRDDFHSEETQESIRGWLIDTMPSEQGAQWATGAVDLFTDASERFNPQWIMEVFERSDKGLACMMLMTHNEQEMLELRDNLLNAVDSPEHRQGLLNQFNEARHQIARGVVSKKDCY